MSTFMIFLISFATISVAIPFPTLVSLKLEKTFLQNHHANVFITLKEGVSHVLSSISSSTFSNREEKLDTLHTALVTHAKRSQEPILIFLSKSKSATQLESFWITNQIYIKNADGKLVSELVGLFSHLISSIDEEYVAHLVEPTSIKPNVSLRNAGDQPQWGIVRIQAVEAWEEVKRTAGLNAGDGVIVATVDTGVRGTHEALRDNYVGNYGWYDPANLTPSPNDHNGHGTHTTGTIVGSRGIGVAPNVKWAACKGCPTVFCFQSSLLACGQFIACPTLADGSEPDCSRAPHVVSNSWGGGRGETWYNGVIDVWHALDIIPVFSIGNSGPICSTVSSPGDQNVIAVGSTTDRDEISTFSSVGPTMDKRLKPEVVAPGSDILSAYHTDDDAYVSMSGTSMSTPFTTGTVALLKMRSRDLDFQEVKELLMGNTDQELKFSGRVCEGVRDNVFPNHVFGHGRINALKSVLAQNVRL